MNAVAKTSPPPASVDLASRPPQRSGPAGAAAWIQRACACGKAAGVSGKCSSCATEEQLGLQPKLGITPTDDHWEREADRVADHVLSDKTGMPYQSPTVTPLVQRQPTGNEEEEELRPQSVARLSRAKVVTEAAAAVRSGGRPLSAAERVYFEPRFGRDLSAVRLHNDARAGTAARAIGARAYTLGSHIAFAPGEYAPHSPDGRHLIAHELTHTLQQGPAAASLQRAESGGSFRGFFHNIALFFGFTRINEAEMEAYLNQIEELGTPAGDFDSDNKALAIANRIEAGGDLFGHSDTVDLRKILIREMQDGATMGDEQTAILFLIMSLENRAPVTQLFEGQNALDANALRSDMGRRNRQRLDNILNAHGISATGMESRANYESCQDAEREAIADAVRQSRADITKAIERLQEAEVSEAVRNSFFLAFRVENPSAEQISTMVSQLNAIRQGVQRVHYICDRGEEESSMCRNGAGGYTSTDPSRDSVSICFMPEPGENAANLAEETDEAKKSNLITHEAAHFYLRVDDNGYFGNQCEETEYARSCLNGTRENCGTSGRPPDERFDNADSYACFVFYLARLAEESREGEGAGRSLAEQAEAYRGGNLGIQVEYPDPLIMAMSDVIYIDEPERTEQFEVTGAPPDSGFSYQWTIVVGEETLPLIASEVWGSPVAHIAYVPEDTKERLRSLHDAGEEEAEVILHTTPYRDAPDSSTVERRFHVRLVSGAAESI